MIDTPVGGTEGGFAPPGAEDFKAPVVVPAVKTTGTTVDTVDTGVVTKKDEDDISEKTDPPIEEIAPTDIATDGEENTSGPEVKESEIKAILERVSAFSTEILDLKSRNIHENISHLGNQEDKTTAIERFAPSGSANNVLIAYDIYKNAIPNPDQAYKVTINNKPLDVKLPDGSVIHITQVKFEDKNTATCTTAEGGESLIISRTALVDAELIAEGDLLLSENSPLKPAQKELIGKYLKILKGEIGRDEMTTEENTTIIDIVEKARTETREEENNGNYFTPEALIPLALELKRDDLIAQLLESGYKVDDPKLLSELFNAESLIAAEKHEMSVLSEDYRTEPSSEKRVEIVDKISQKQEGLKLSQELKNRLSQKGNKELMDGVVARLANGELPSAVKQITDAISSSTSTLAVIKQIAQEQGVKVDLTKIEAAMKKYGKPAAKIGLLAAIALMYALMKSGKEQPQGYQ